MTDSIITSNKVFADSNKVLELFSEEGKEDFKSYVYESKFFQNIQNTPTDFSYIKEREGQDKRIFEYFSATYTIMELNRLFPGWWQEDMKLSFNYKLKTVRVEGYLCVNYPTFKGRIPTKRWASASFEMKVSKDIDEKIGFYKVVNADDIEKAAVSEWFKVAGKLYGIGIDLYHQQITNELRNIFKDKIKDIPYPYKKVYEDEAKSYTTGHSYRKYIKRLPNIKQVKKIKSILNKIPEHKKDVRSLLWEKFTKLRNNGELGRKQFDDWLQKLEEKFEETELQNKNTELQNKNKE